MFLETIPSAEDLSTVATVPGLLPPPAKVLRTNPGGLRLLAVNLPSVAPQARDAAEQLSTLGTRLFLPFTSPPPPLCQAHLPMPHQRVFSCEGFLT